MTKHFFGVLAFIFFATVPAFAELVLYANAEFNVESAKNFVLDGIKYKINPETYIDKMFDRNNGWHKENLKNGKTQLEDRTLAYFSDSTYGVLYHDEMNYTYYYDSNGLLIYVDQKDGKGTTYPHRFYKYKANGELVNMGVRVSKDECYIYSTDEKMIAHWIGENAYDAKNQIIMQRKWSN